MAPKNKKKKDQQPTAASLKTTKKWREHADLIPLIPLAFILLIVPLIMYAKVPSPEAAALMIEPTGTTRLELSAYYKGICFLIAAVLSMMVMLGKKLKGDLTIQKSPLFYPLILFLIMAVISTLTSAFRPVALSGYHGRYEGLYILLGYGAVFFVATQLVKTKKQFMFLLTTLWASTVIMSVIGLLQATGMNPFLTETVQRMILPREYHEFIGDFAGAGGGRNVFLTMGNSNYAGSYLVMMLAVFLPLMFFAGDKRLKGTLLISNSLMLFLLILSGSRTGYGTLVICLLVLSVLLRRVLARRWKLFLVILGVLTAANILASTMVPRTLINGIITGIQTIVIKTEPYPTRIKDLVIDENRLSLIGTRETLTIQMNQEGDPVYTDETDRLLQWEAEESEDTAIETHHITTSGFERYRVEWEPHEHGKLLGIHNGSIRAEFFFHENQFYIIGHRGELVSYQPVPTFGFVGRERLGASRGYIWSRSIPLLRETLVFGHGPDTFFYYFPQNDYLGVLQRKIRATLLIDKPHNFYLQTAIQTGVISLVALLTLFGTYLVHSFRRYIRIEHTDWQSKTGIALLSGCIAYLATGLFNDSIIGISALFWVILGMGASLLLQEPSGPDSL